MPLTELGDSAAQITAIEGRPGVHILRIPQIDAEDNVIGYIVQLEIAEGNAVLRSDPVFMPGDEETFPASVTGQSSDVEGRARLQVVRAPLWPTGSSGMSGDSRYVAWLEQTMPGGVVRRSEPLVVIPPVVADGGGGGGTEIFVVENRTSDPSSPEVGRIWLRTDL